MTAAVLCQFHDGRLLLLHDWVREGNPGELVEPLYNESVLLADSPRSPDAGPAAQLVRHAQSPRPRSPRHPQRAALLGGSRPPRGQIHQCRPDAGHPAIPAELRLGGGEPAVR